MPKLSAPLALALLAAFLALPACAPKPGQGPPTGAPGVIQCGTKAIADHAAEGLGPVNACLSGKDDVSNCLIGLVEPAAGITIDLVLCLVRHEGSAANAASQANPDDAVDVRRAARAKEFLAKEGARFAD